MAIYYDIVYNKAIKQCDRVHAARKNCESARKSLDILLQSICENWKGTAGEAYDATLVQYIQRLDGLIGTLETTEAQMRREARAVLDEWPNNAEIEGE